MHALFIGLNSKNHRFLLVGDYQKLEAKAEILKQHGVDYTFFDTLILLPEQTATGAIIATDCLEKDTHLAALCRSHGLLVNVVDRPELCDFIFPAVLTRGDVQIAVSTGGRAPVLTRWLKNRIAAMLPS
ncbi:MAG: hypothetical protein LW855_05345, partial [Alphaproteobacteria bacterium]|nr:hypothetical protein [Alphaproteobacteria bacterium]